MQFQIKTNQYKKLATNKNKLVIVKKKSKTLNKQKFKLS